MNRRTIYGAAAIVLFAVRARAQDRHPVTRSAHDQIAEIFAADSADRVPGRLDGLTDSARASVMRSVVARDGERLTRIRALIGANTGLSSPDYYHAAMVAQHGQDSTAFRSAHEWAREAVALDSTNGPAKYLIAASWDRYLRAIGKPQWYGTQIVRRPGRPFELLAIDTTRVTDADRIGLNVPVLAALRARVDSLNTPRP